MPKTLFFSLSGGGTGWCACDDCAWFAAASVEDVVAVLIVRPLSTGPLLGRFGAGAPLLPSFLLCGAVDGKDEGGGIKSAGVPARVLPGVATFDCPPPGVPTAPFSEGDAGVPAPGMGPGIGIARFFGCGNDPSRRAC